MAGSVGCRCWDAKRLVQDDTMQPRRLEWADRHPKEHNNITVQAVQLACRRLSGARDPVARCWSRVAIHPC